MGERTNFTAEKSSNPERGRDHFIDKLSHYLNDFTDELPDARIEPPVEPKPVNITNLSPDEVAAAEKKFMQEREAYDQDLDNYRRYKCRSNWWSNLVLTFDDLIYQEIVDPKARVILDNFANEIQTMLNDNPKGMRTKAQIAEADAMIQATLDYLEGRSEEIETPGMPLSHMA
ncbi:MAG: hypothetical protein COT81_04445 [Candidatus Buchananbacteria bacterium CG10_big_fil_rev_8_21_14_0_10_42_9]|uniref:Uncharacterized protein n=1 Tax=Candidatus Buchananbacteria bacterium CG10_big_fil_rev_8_21_14_0_10_42_9 TaxID=1974526 RepID=A0A2H0W0G5_9BACT|nr:MAG: hypothetical protein COT81_04445 [Candidatus Buchananbacteria bacterium CG10_big_fil_rev_8_21_14_0_10_42_9]